MPKEFSRKVRVSNSIRKLVAPIVDRISKDHGFGLVSVTEVAISGDLKHCEIYISVFGSEEQQARAVDYFKANAASIRSELAGSLTIKHIPEVSFKADNALEQGDKMARLLNETKIRPTSD